MATLTLTAASPGQMERVRASVAKYFESVNRDDLSRIVTDGEGDDFPEVQVALGLLKEQLDVLDRFRAALLEYAAPDFWDDSLPGGSLAQHDSGEMARNVLAGRPHFFHRD